MHSNSINNKRKQEEVLDLITAHKRQKRDVESINLNPLDYLSALPLEIQQAILCTLNSGKTDKLSLMQANDTYSLLNIRAISKLWHSIMDSWINLFVKYVLSSPDLSFQNLLFHRINREIVNVFLYNQNLADEMRIKPNELTPITKALYTLTQNAKKNKFLFFPTKENKLIQSLPIPFTNTMISPFSYAGLSDTAIQSLVLTQQGIKLHILVEIYQAITPICEQISKFSDDPQDLFTYYSFIKKHDLINKLFDISILVLFLMQEDGKEFYNHCILDLQAYCQYLNKLKIEYNSKDGINLDLLSNSKNYTQPNHLAKIESMRQHIFVAAVECLNGHHFAPKEQQNKKIHINWAGLNFEKIILNYREPHQIGQTLTICNTNMTDLRLNGATLENINIETSSLIHSDLKNCSLTNALFTHSFLTDINFKNTKIFNPRSSIKNCTLKNVKLLENPNYENLNLQANSIEHSLCYALNHTPNSVNRDWYAKLKLDLVMKFNYKKELFFTILDSLQKEFCNLIEMNLSELREVDASLLPPDKALCDIKNDIIAYAKSSKNIKCLQDALMHPLFNNTIYSSRHTIQPQWVNDYNNQLNQYRNEFEKKIVEWSHPQTAQLNSTINLRR